MFLASALLCRLVSVTLLLHSLWSTFKQLRLSERSAESNFDGPPPSSQRRRRASSGDDGSETEATASLLRTWTLLSFLSLFESWLEWGVSWLPFYFEVKLGLLCWLIGHRSPASRFLFERCLQPVVGRVTAYASLVAAPYLASSVMSCYARLLPTGIAAIMHCITREELRQWDSLVDAQLAMVQEELRRRGRAPTSRPALRKALAAAKAAAARAGASAGDGLGDDDSDAEDVDGSEAVGGARGSPGGLASLRIEEVSEARSENSDDDGGGGTPFEDEDDAAARVDGKLRVGTAGDSALDGAGGEAAQPRRRFPPGARQRRRSVDADPAGGNRVSWK